MLWWFDAILICFTQLAFCLLACFVLICFSYLSVFLGLLSGLLIGWLDCWLAGWLAGWFGGWVAGWAAHQFVLHSLLPCLTVYLLCFDLLYLLCVSFGVCWVRTDCARLARSWHSLCSHGHNLKLLACLRALVCFSGYSLFCFLCLSYLVFFLTLLCLANEDHDWLAYPKIA